MLLQYILRKRLSKGSTMRLINTSTYQLQEFIGATKPSYTTLSHTWGDEEVSFLEWRAYSVSLLPDLGDPLQTRPGPGWVERIRKKAGFKKITEFCKKSLQSGHNWAWVDTCCIDKSSSEELSEAINSMFTWYQRSECCYCYLSDVNDSSYSWVEEGFQDYLSDLSVSAGDIGDSFFERYNLCGFTKSRWFKRGWTLQELLAPCDIYFYDRDWQLIGRRSRLARVIETISKIPADALSAKNPLYIRFGQDTVLSGYSIAQKMSWASMRSTTRAEDMAYCLFGLFDVNMPLLYGEGQIKAFRRLQEEIIKRSTDHSLFAWSIPTDRGIGKLSDTIGSILADSPAVFEGAAHIVRSDYSDYGIQRFMGIKKSYTVTNHGLLIELPLIPCPLCTERGKISPEERCYLALLNCSLKKASLARLGICLRPKQKGQFERAHCHYLSIDKSMDAGLHYADQGEIYIRTDVQMSFLFD